jgi:hypothetical protein
MSSSSILLIDTRPAHDLLVTETGEPVWPAGTDSDRLALATVAETFGASVQEVRGQEGDSVRSADLVVGLGETVEEEARLYAHLTQRGFREAGSISELAACGPAAVIVTTGAFLHEELFGLLWSYDPHLPTPGIICGGFSDGLRRQVLVRAAASRLSGEMTTRRVDLLLTGSVGDVAGTHEVLGRDAGPQRVRDALGRNVGVLTLLAHSDGIDAYLGEGLTLCPMDRMLLQTDPSRRPRCVTTGYCHRQEGPIEEWLDGELLAPETIAARILLFETCWGVMPPDGAVDPSWGLLPRFLDSPRLGAIVANAGVALVSPALVRPLAEAIESGTPVGSALSDFARSPEVRTLARRFVLFGDPAVSLPTRTPVTAWRAARPKRRGRARPDGPRQIGFLLRAILYDITSGRRNLGQDLTTPAETALAALHRYESALWHGRPTEEGPSAVGPALRRALLPCLCRRGPDVYDAWLRYASLEVEQGRPRERCFACAGPRNLLTKLVASFPHLGIGPRRISYCPRCGFVEDAPADSTFTFRVYEGQSVRLGGELPNEHWAAALLIKPMVPDERVWWEWPSDGDGRPARSFAPPSPWPIGQLEVAVILLSGARLTILCMRGRGDREPAERPGH